MTEKKVSIVKYETERGEVTLSPEIVKKYLVSGEPQAVTPQEVIYFLNICKYQRLNPFLREAYLIKYSPKYPATIVVGKDVFVKRASKNPDCEGWQAGVIVRGEDGEIVEREGSFVLPDEELVGGWAVVYRKGWKQPFKVTVALDEYIKKDKEGNPQSSWANMPATMIRKVALVQALREAFPEDFQGLYAPEEFSINSNTLDAQPVVVEEVEEEEQEAEEEPQEKPQPQSKQRQQKQANGSRGATEAQIKFIEQLASEEDLKEILNKEYGGKSLKELTIKEASDLIGVLKQNVAPF